MILEATLISLKVVSIAVAITLCIAIIAVYILDDGRKSWGKVLNFFMILPMFIPPSAVGYLILITLGRNGFIGKIFRTQFNISIIFTVTAAIIASIIVTLPIMYQSIKSAVMAVDPEIKNAAKICGASNGVIFIKIILPLSKRGILNGVLLSFARAFGEFGATILVAGNIPGKTQTLPMSLYYAMENNNNEEARKILIIILVVAVFLMSLYSFFTNR